MLAAPATTAVIPCQQSPSPRQSSPAGAPLHEASSDQYSLRGSAVPVPPLSLTQQSWIPLPHRHPQPVAQPAIDLPPSPPTPPANPTPPLPGPGADPPRTLACPVKQSARPQWLARQRAHPLPPPSRLELAQLCNGAARKLASRSGPTPQTLRSPDAKR